jgi:lipopolysaccharide export system protein LptA
VRFTIERLRTLVLAAGILLLVALGAFLAVARFRQPFNVRELPKRLGVDIQQEANGVTYSHSLGAHAQYKIHASKEVQLKEGIVQLHGVKIELYGEDGGRVDRIEGDEFEYDPKSGKAVAAGPVAITLMRPGVAPAVAPKAIPDKGIAEKVKGKPLTAAAEAAAAGQIQVKTSGLVFDWHSGITTTSKHVDFSLAQGAGSSMGATYDSQQGILVLDRQVELTTTRGDDTVAIHAGHAVFERDNLACSMSGVTAEYRDGVATASMATILFRSDGSAVRLEVTNGLTLASAAGGHLAAPTGRLEFDEHNLPRHGHLEGGVRIDSANGNRQMHGSSPSAELEFTPKGEIKLAHLERGVEIRSEQTSPVAANSKTGAGLLRVSRTWRSPVAEVAFRDAGHGKIEPASIHGTGGVVIAGVSQRAKGAPAPSKLAADDLVGTFGAGASLTSMTGVGHALVEQTTTAGDLQTANGDRLETRFDTRPGSPGSDTEIQSAVLDGHVVLVEQPAAKTGAHAQPPMRATAGHAVYEGTGKWLHLTQSPRVADGDLQLTADKVDVSEDSGNAFAHGNVKASWLESDKSGQTGAHGNTGPEGLSLGGRGPAHAVASEAEIDRNSGEAIFKGHARLWQQANSIAGPVLVINRGKRTLVARSADRGDPVRVVLLSAEGLEPDGSSSKTTAAGSNGSSVVRVRGGELKYFDAARRALIVGGSLGAVTAETGTATSLSDQVELFLAPAGHNAKVGAQGQVDHMTSTGHVVVSAEGRRGTGEQLTYTSRTGEYVLTGTSSTPPRIVDPARGNVTGEALIFHSRDDSVSIEGGGHTTRTETTVSRGSGKSEPIK